MQTRRIKFVGFGDERQVRDMLIFKILAERFNIELSDSPDYVFFCSGGEHFRYNDRVKIVIQRENLTVDFNAYDFGIGFDHMMFGDRYLRNPLFARHPAFASLASNHKEQPMSNDQLLHRKFCSFVVSHQSTGNPIREKFFRRLSQYKKVDSGGRFLNNIGGPVKDKLSFCRDYKFNIAFENSSSPGYTTEKIMEAYAARTVPIYYGNPSIETDFNTRSMVRVVEDQNIEEAVAEVIRLDNDDDAYLAKLAEPCLAVEDPTLYRSQLADFLYHIFDLPLCKAIRRNKYGCQGWFERREALLHKVYYSIVESWPYSAARRVYTLLKRARGGE